MSESGPSGSPPSLALGQWAAELAFHDLAPSREAAIELLVHGECQSPAEERTALRVHGLRARSVDPAVRADAWIRLSALYDSPAARAFLERVIATDRGVAGDPGLRSVLGSRVTELRSGAVVPEERARSLSSAAGPRSVVEAWLAGPRREFDPGSPARQGVPPDGMARAFGPAYGEEFASAIGPALAGAVQAEFRFDRERRESRRRAGRSGHEVDGLAAVRRLTERLPPGFRLAADAPFALEGVPGFDLASPHARVSIVCSDEVAGDPNRFRDGWRETAVAFGHLELAAATPPDPLLSLALSHGSLIDSVSASGSWFEIASLPGESPQVSLSVAPPFFLQPPEPPKRSLSMGCQAAMWLRELALTGLTHERDVEGLPAHPSCRVICERSPSHAGPADAQGVRERVRRAARALRVLGARHERAALPVARLVDEAHDRLHLDLVALCDDDGARHLLLRLRSRLHALGLEQAWARPVPGFSPSRQSVSRLDAALVNDSTGSGRSRRRRQREPGL